MILDKIAESTRIRVEARKQALPLAELAEKAREHAQKNDFPFEHALRAPGISFICEVKKASPSKGVIAEDFPYLAIAKEYEEAGAAAISVLTEPDYFQGSDTYLSQIADKTACPVLRKDFTIDAYQIYEAKLLGASAVLLICALLSDKLLFDFLNLAHSLGLSALVEAHDETEVKRAAAAGVRIIGVNNRDLRTFQVDMQTSLRLRQLAPSSCVFVSESGISTPEHIAQLRHAGVDAVLVGETLMRSADKAEALRRLSGES